MKVSQIGEKTKTKELLVSCHGCDYSITSDFRGIRIDKIDLVDRDLAEEIRVLPISSSAIIVC